MYYQMHAWKRLQRVEILHAVLYFDWIFDWILTNIHNYIPFQYQPMQSVVQSLWLLSVHIALVAF